MTRAGQRDGGACWPTRRRCALASELDHSATLCAQLDAESAHRVSAHRVSSGAGERAATSVLPPSNARWCALTSAHRGVVRMSETFLVLALNLRAVAVAITHSICAAHSGLPHCLPTARCAVSVMRVVTSPICHKLSVFRSQNAPNQSKSATVFFCAPGQDFYRPKKKFCQGAKRKTNL